MNRKLFVTASFLFALGAGIGAGAAVSLTQEGMPMPKPTKHHKVLQRDAGVWDAEAKVWMGPDADPMVSRGEERNQMLGDFWVVSTYKGDMMGMPFEGRSVAGYDENKEKYVGIWVDSMSAHMATYEGTWDADTNTMTNMVESVDQMTGEPSQQKHVIKYTDDNTRVFSMFGANPLGGDDIVKTMEITYRRRAD